MFANRSVQVFLIILAAIAALATLMGIGSIPTDQGLPALTAVIGFGVGAPIQPPPNP